MSLSQLMRALVPNRRGSRNLTADEAYSAFDSILSGSESEITVAAFLTALRMKGVTVEELTGFAQAARGRAVIPCLDVPNLVCVSPPNDGLERGPVLEVAAGLIAAGAGARVLIMTDRCSPPKRGLTAVSVLESLGTGMTWDPREAEDWVLKTRFAACAVTGMLPGLMGLRQVRGDIAVRTPLSTVEKLISPKTAAVVLGAHEGPVLGTAVQVIQGLGHPRGAAVQGPEGNVVPSVTRRTRGIELTDGHLVPLNVEPEDFGLRSESEPDMPMFGPPPDGHGAGDNPELVKFVGDQTRKVLAGERGPARSAALLAAALFLKAAGKSLTLAEGIDASTSSLDSGAADEVLMRLREMTN
jgi:anthranilate phosphoribosyltransferase